MLTKHVVVQSAKGQTLQVLGAGGAVVKKATWAPDISALNIEDQDLVAHRLSEPGGLWELIHFAITAGEILRRDRSYVRLDEFENAWRQVIFR